jgi:hypothetical protein
MMTTDSTVRSELIAGLRRLAQFLADNPKVPVPDYGKIVVFANGSDKEQRATIDRIADLIGASVSDSTHYVAIRDFGPITYEAIAIPEQRMEDHRALMSYDGAVSAGEL